MLRVFITLVFISCSLLCPTPTNAQTDEECSQPERKALMKEAEKRHFALRRVEFVGLTYTPDEKMRSQMRNFNEGDIFSRARLIEVLKKMNRFRSEIYPVRLTDLMLRLNEEDKTVDITICFRPKRR